MNNNHKEPERSARFEPITVIMVTEAEKSFPKKIKGVSYENITKEPAGVLHDGDDDDRAEK